MAATTSTVAERAVHSAVPLSRLLALWFGCGLSPVGPGTVGSLGAVPLWWVLRAAPSPVGWVAVLVVSAVGYWASEREATRLGQKDPSSVVIDEVAGVLLAWCCVAGLGVGAEVAAFVAFRALDIGKPWPISAAERLRPAGAGIMADDLVAGLAAGLIVRGVWMLCF